MVNPCAGNHNLLLVALNVNDFCAITDYCHAERIDLVVVGAEDPLAAGIADHLIRDNIAVFGPTRAAAEIEVCLMAIFVVESPLI
jgi:phosphoribosylamine-glycine ligase